MANIKLVFCEIDDSQNEVKELQVYINQFDKLILFIDDSANNSKGWDNSQFIALDKETAIKFSKELRKQISLID
jgi:hypothetical protein